MGRQWNVLGAYALHVFLLAAGALLLVPRIGLLGYGLADLLACFAYPVLQLGTARSVGNLSRVLWTWVGAFGVLLAVPFMKGVWSVLPVLAFFPLAALARWIDQRDSRSQPLGVLQQALLRG